MIPYDVLPDWLKDNDYLLHGHRPPMPSFRACFRSIFRIHTETGNIWTHLLGDCREEGALGLEGLRPCIRVRMGSVLGPLHAQGSLYESCACRRIRHGVPGAPGTPWEREIRAGLSHCRSGMGKCLLGKTGKPQRMFL